ncbi:MAG: M42 family metallopeptidase [Candidatus Aenigmarchaeota archaeon]|nr:M42 family metallopeptidase [Candidatus Aenigmarchaeota archaeon]
MEDLLKKLVDAPSISGSEKDVRDLMERELKRYVDEIKVDKIGNLIARKGKGKPKIMLAAHMDELGLMVKFIDDKGFIRFDVVGGWDERILPAKKFKIHGSKGSVVGVIGSKPPHLQEREEQKVPFKLKDMYIDVGARNKKDVEKAGIRVGDFITRYGQLDHMISSRITGYGFDNRIGCLVMIEAMKRLKKVKGTVYAVGTIQEEMGLIGIRGSTFGIDPDVVIALDTTIAGDTPELKPGESGIKLGAGPALAIKDAVGVISPKVKRWVTDAAKKARVPLQYEVMSGGATDASVVPMIREGIPSGSILVPSRYVHTPIEVADMKDIEKTVKLVVETVKSASKYF